MTNENNETIIEELTPKLDALLDPRILRAIREMGFTQMSPIQEQAIPSLL